MNRIIEVSVKNKTAVQTNEAVYICGNSDFVVNFDFDDEWDDYECKTARFIFNDKFIDVVFSNNVCPVPIISDTYKIKVGVYAGDLQSTKPALISAAKSILCGSPAPAAPHPDVYAQMKDLFEAGLNSAWEGANAADAARKGAEAAQTAAEKSAEQSAQSAKESAEQAKAAQEQAKQAGKHAKAAAQSAGNAKASEEAAAKSAVQAAEIVNNAAWVGAEINESGHLIVTQTDNFNGAVFAINDNGNLEVSYT